MRLLFVGKRHPQQRDLVERPYGRFYHLPVCLAALGHDVRTLGARKLLRKLSDEAKDFLPDWIIGCSDTWCGWLAHRLAHDLGAKLAVDAYDNYEAYMPWNMPLHWLWRRAIRAADLVTAAGPQLAERLQAHRRCT